MKSRAVLFRGSVCRVDGGQSTFALKLCFDQMALCQEYSNLVFHLRTEGVRLVDFFPRGRLEVAKVVFTGGVCALPVPGFRHAGEVYDRRIVE